jgi:hypothetical protein
MPTSSKERLTRVNINLKVINLKVLNHPKPRGAVDFGISSRL